MIVYSNSQTHLPATYRCCSCWCRRCCCESEIHYFV